ncbi:phosphatase PAP2 family protein [candidate division KSB1 bacterium]|nr:phosphatase PAP2 family protein [candidate division KSB1 bacterium]
MQSLKPNHLERFTAFFAIGFGTLIWVLSGFSSEGARLLMLNIGVAAIVLLTLPNLRSAKNLVAIFFGIALPLLVFYLFYRESMLVLGMPNIEWHDLQVSFLEAGLWQHKENNFIPLIGDWFAFSYMVYVPMIILVIVMLIIRTPQGSQKSAESIVRHICLAWAMCYITFVTYPVLGPRLFYPDLQGPRMGSGLFSILAQFNHNNGMLYGGSFPSAHVAAIIVVLWNAWKARLPWFWVFLFLGVNLIAATVYLCYHYVSDILAGLMVGFLAISLDRLWMMKRLNVVSILYSNKRINTITQKVSMYLSESRIKLK